MSCQAKVSVIIPVYNVERYLPFCLESCLRQTLFDVEFICVNDGSTDDSGEILKHYGRLDTRFKILEQKNSGLSAARNTGIRSSNGKWIMFLDSDDYLADNACERVWRETEEAPTDVVVFGTNIFPALPKANRWYENVLYTPTCRFDNFSPEVLLETPGGKPFVWRQAFAGTLLKESDVLFDESVKYGEDLIFQMEIFPEARHFSFLSDRLYHYRWCRSDSLMSKANEDADKKTELHLRMVEIIAKYWQEHGFLGKYGSSFLEWALDFMVVDLRSVPMERTAEHARHLREIIQKYQLKQYKKGMKWESKELWHSLFRM